MQRSARRPPAATALRVETRSAEETAALGAALGRAAFRGAVLLLDGPLGAGKTVLARGVAEGLGVAVPPTSPTFTIVAEHAGRLPLFHVDLYRIESPEDLRSVDLGEVFEAGGVAVVEWPRWLLQDSPAGTLDVEIRPAASEVREIELRPRDPRWREPLSGLPLPGWKLR